MTETLNLSIKEKEERKFLLDSDGNIALRVSDLQSETLQSLIITLQELTHRLSLLGAVKGVNESLRVTPISSVSTAVTGPITSAQSIAEKNVAGVAWTQRIALENLNCNQNNIINCIGK